MAEGHAPKVRRLALLLALVGLLAAPGARAHMDVDPDELELPAGYYTHVRVEIENSDDRPFEFELRARGDGLLVTFEERGGRLGPHERVELRATVRAPPWVAGDRVVGILLYEDGELVADEEIEVFVEAPLGMGEGTLRLLAGATLGGLGGGALAGLVAWRRWHLLALALYMRLDRERVDAHPSRARLLEIVRREPGISLAEAQRRAGLANGPFEHHLRKLRESHRIVVHEEGRARFLALPETPQPDAPGGTGARVALYVRERGKVRAAEAARDLALSRQALHYHIHKLSAQGLLDARLERGRLVLLHRGVP